MGWEGWITGQVGLEVGFEFRFTTGGGQWCDRLGLKSFGLGVRLGQVAKSAQRRQK